MRAAHDPVASPDKDRTPRSGSSRWLKRGLIPAVSAFVLSLAMLATGGPATAVVVTPGIQGGFEVDGDQDVDNAPNIDWASVDPLIIMEDTPVNGDSMFSPGASAKEEAPGLWACQYGNVNNKTDLARAYVNQRIEGDDVYLDLAWVGEELANSPSMTVSFEFSQTPVADQPASSIPGSCAVNRIVGDVLITYDFPGGNAPVNIQMFEWDGDSWEDTGLSASDVNAANNLSGSITDFVVGGTISAERFGEASINLTEALMPPGGGNPVCQTFGTVGVRARQSGSTFSSNLTDRLPNAGVNVSTCAQITIVKNTVPDAAEDFTFDPSAQVNGGTNFVLDDDGSLQNPSATPNSMTFDVLPGVTHTVAEVDDANDDYQLTAIDCGTGGVANLANGTVTFENLAIGQQVTCTFTNARSGRIEIEKQTLPDGSPTEFTFTGDVAGTLSDGDNTGEDVAPGTYTSTETVPAGWALTSIICDDTDSSGDTATGIATFNVDPGETVRCIYTNTQGASVTVRKVTDPASSPQDFDFDLTGSGLAVHLDLDTDAGDATLPASQTFVLNAGQLGAKTITESAQAGWTLTDLDCTGDADFTENGATASLDVDAGETIVCTYTNTQDATVTVTKVTVPAGNSTDFGFTSGIAGLANFTLDGNAGDDLVSNTTGPAVVAPGQYVITEGAAPANWALTSVVCSEGTGNPGAGTASITVDPGDAINCTFTNTFTAPEPECPEEGVRGAFNRGGEECPEEEDDDYDEEAEEDDAGEDALDDDPLENAGDPVDVSGNNDQPVISGQTDTQNPPAAPADPALSPAGEDAPIPLQQLPRTGSSVNLMKQAMLALLLVIIGVPAMVFGRRRRSAQA